MAEADSRARYTDVPVVDTEVANPDEWSNVLGDLGGNVIATYWLGARLPEGTQRELFYSGIVGAGVPAKDILPEHRARRFAYPHIGPYIP